MALSHRLSCNLPGCHKSCWPCSLWVCYSGLFAFTNPCVSEGDLFPSTAACHWAGSEAFGHLVIIWPEGGPTLDAGLLDSQQPRGGVRSRIGFRERHSVSWWSFPGKTCQPPFSDNLGLTCTINKTVYNSLHLESSLFAMIPAVDTLVSLALQSRVTAPSTSNWCFILSELI